MFGRKKFFRGKVCEQDYRHAMRSFDVPFLNVLATRIGESEGDTERYHALQNRIALLKTMPERIKIIEKGETS